MSCAIFKCCGSSPAVSGADKPKSSVPTPTQTPSNATCLTPEMISGIVAALLAVATGYCYLQGVGTIATAGSGALCAGAIATTVVLHCRKPATDPAAAGKKNDDLAAANAAAASSAAAPAKLTAAAFLKEFRAATKVDDFDFNAKLANLEDGALSTVLLDMCTTIGTDCTKDNVQLQLAVAIVKASLDKLDAALTHPDTGLTLLESAVEERAHIDLINELARNKALVTAKSVDPKAGAADADLTKAGRMVLMTSVAPLIIDDNSDETNAYGDQVLLALADNSDPADKAALVKFLKNQPDYEGKKADAVYSKQLTILGA
jgi:hypothetical protein